MLSYQSLFDKDYIGGANKIVEKIDNDNIYTANYISNSKQTILFGKAIAEKELETKRVKQ